MDVSCESFNHSIFDVNFIFVLLKGVNLETLIKFNRLKSLSTDFKEILKAVKNSNSGLLEVNFKLVYLETKF